MVGNEQGHFSPVFKVIGKEESCTRDARAFGSNAHDGDRGKEQLRARIINSFRIKIKATKSPTAPHGATQSIKIPGKDARLTDDDKPPRNQPRNVVARPKRMSGL